MISVDVIRAEMERVDAIRIAANRLRAVIEKVADEELRIELETAAAQLEGECLVCGGR